MTPGVDSKGSEMLSSMLAAASPEDQKSILGERLYPLVAKHQVNTCSQLSILPLILIISTNFNIYIYLYVHALMQPDLVAKITGMLLEMDNSELLVLLDSPESLAEKVEEAVQVLKLSKAKVSTPGALRSNYLSAGVAVN